MNRKIEDIQAIYFYVRVLLTIKPQQNIKLLS